MAKPWDDTLKKLIRLDPPAFVSFLLPQAHFIAERSYVLEQEELEMDGLLEVETNAKRMLLHIEFQAYHDKKMAGRLLRYNVLAREKYQLPVLSCVIYLLKDDHAPTSPLIWDIPTGEEILLFRFVNVKLSDVTAEDIFRIGESTLIPLLPLTKGGATKQTVKRMFDEIQAFKDIEETRKADLELIGYSLAALIFRRMKSKDQDWLARSFQQMHDILRDTPIYQMILQEGREEGREEASRMIEEERKRVLDSQRVGLVDLVEARFPALKALAKAQAAQIESPPLLANLTIKIALTQSLEEAVEHLVNWKTIYKDLLN